MFKSLTVAVFTTIFAMQAYAKTINSGTIPVQSEITYYEVEVEAKCLGPRFEDDGFRVYYSPQSYNEVKQYLDSGYSRVLLDRTCGYSGQAPNLSSTQYEKVRILFYNSSAAQKEVEALTKTLLKQYGL